MDTIQCWLAGDRIKLSSIDINELGYSREGDTILGLNAQIICLAITYRFRAAPPPRCYKWLTRTLLFAFNNWRPRVASKSFFFKSRRVPTSYTNDSSAMTESEWEPNRPRIFWVYVVAFVLALPFNARSFSPLLFPPHNIVLSPYNATLEQIVLLTT